MAGQSQWVTDLYIKSDTKEILSIGQPPPGGVAGTTQVDVMRCKPDYNPTVGQILDPQQVDDIYEVKTSVQQEISPAQRQKLAALLDSGRECKISRPPRRYTTAGGWHDHPKFKKAVALLGVFGGGACVYAMVMSADNDEQMDEISMKIQEVKYAQVDQKKIIAAQAAQDISDFIKRYTPEDTAVDLVTVVSIYDMLSKADW